MTVAISGSAQATEAAQLIVAWRDGQSARQSAISDHRRADGAAVDNCSSGICEPIRATDRSYSLWLELEYRCNLDCLFCYNPWRATKSPEPGRQLISSETMTAFVEQVMSILPVHHVTLSGGEPLLQPGIFQIARASKDAGATVSITTNGRSGTRARVAKLAQAGVSHIAVPVHSHRGEVHDALAAGPSWHGAVTTLALGREFGFSTTVSCVITRKNVHDIGGVCDIVEWLGADRFVLNRFHAVGQGIHNASELDISAGMFHAAVEKARRRLGSSLPVEVGSPGPQEPNEKGSKGATVPRRATVDRIAVSPFGDVKFCNQSVQGVLDITSASHDEISALLEHLACGNHEELLERVDNCTCLGTL
ncbi:radical SAM protein [Streptomyces griseoloalbus]|uniref:radical SAM protein n=1 Tax=Streptomyces griseoloalbus TaxID=67303 RepID=UPI0033B4138F